MKDSFSGAPPASDRAAVIATYVVFARVIRLIEGRRPDHAQAI